MLILAGVLFWISVFCVVYTYLIYPLILRAIISARRETKRDIPAPEADNRGLPAVSMIISAYNEEKVIEEKLNNCMALNYPPTKLEILIGSDGSTDHTDSIIEGFIRQLNSPISFRFVKLPRGGKTAVLNKLVPAAEGEIIVFSDANSLYQPDSVVHLVKHFSNLRVGCVCGELKLGASGLRRRNTEQNYWGFEIMLKRLESRLGAVAGCNGGIYAIRRDLFIPLPGNTLVDDFLISMRIGLAGFDCIYEPQAVAGERTAKTIRDEFRRRVRIGCGNIQNLLRLKEIYRFQCWKLAFTYLSHKVIRWLVPFFLVVILASNCVLLHSQAYLGIFLLQVIFYCFALAGYAVDRFGFKLKVLEIPYVFITMNLALLIGFFRYCRGVRQATWERTER